jgi:hypothetical protein
MPLESVSGIWSRNAVETEPGLNYNISAYPQKVKLPADLERHINGAKDPRVVLTFINGPYTPDPAGTDVWITSFKSGEGDCDSKAISAVDICYSYMRDDWIPMIAMGDAWLSGKSDPNERVVTKHAYNVFVSRRSDDVVVGEPTYLVEGFDDMGPGSGHIIEVKYLLAPGAAIRVEDGRNDMGKDTPTHVLNEVLVDAIKREVAGIKDVLNKRYDEYVSPLPPAELVQTGTSEYGMPILKIKGETFADSSKGVQ